MDSQLRGVRQPQIFLFVVVLWVLRVDHVCGGHDESIFASNTKYIYVDRHRNYLDVVDGHHVGRRDYWFFHVSLLFIVGCVHND